MKLKKLYNAAINGINYVGFANYGSRIQQAIQAVNEVYLGEKNDRSNEI